MSELEAHFVWFCEKKEGAFSCNYRFLWKCLYHTHLAIDNFPTISFFFCNSRCHPSQFVKRPIYFLFPSRYDISKGTTTTKKKSLVYLFSHNNSISLRRFLLSTQLVPNRCNLIQTLSRLNGPPMRRPIVCPFLDTPQLVPSFFSQGGGGHVTTWSASSNGGGVMQPCEVLREIVPLRLIVLWYPRCPDR